MSNTSETSAVKTLIGAAFAIIIAIGNFSYHNSDEAKAITEHGMCHVMDKDMRRYDNGSGNYTWRYFVETDCGVFRVSRKQYRDFDKDTDVNITTQGTRKTGIVNKYPKVVSYHK